MKLAVLRRGTRNRALTRKAQTFLLGLGLYRGKVDGLFGPLMDAGVRRYQRRRHLVADGIIGNQTWGAMMAEGLVLVPSTTAKSDRHGPNWPPRPPGLRTLGKAGRERVFGHIAFEHRPSASNPERIVITNDWAVDNLTRVVVPGLSEIAHAPNSGRITVHKKAAPKLVELFEAWADAGLLDRVIAWSGAYNPRFIRGSRTTLSNHAYGTAFDINAGWNGLGARPALVGQEGSVRELVPLANKLGWFWGGHYNRRLDGMHFELVRP